MKSALVLPLFSNEVCHLKEDHSHMHLLLLLQYCYYFPLCLSRTYDCFPFFFLTVWPTVVQRPANKEDNKNSGDRAVCDKRVSIFQKLLKLGEAFWRGICNRQNSDDGINGVQGLTLHPPPLVLGRCNTLHSTAQIRAAC
uniref:Uncharacterized protein n=1 Tax=Trypanosoma congolense (strain IL3000) TaxID=1068625 RepID=F9W969_TRYCI|nr:hypothetical protein, unlikely [Trypanosoma congolense IL3000]